MILYVAVRSGLTKDNYVPVVYKESLHQSTAALDSPGHLCKCVQYGRLLHNPCSAEYLNSTQWYIVQGNNMAAAKS
jgi:hypothetical protein